MMLFNVGSANEIRKLVFKSYTEKHFTRYVCSTCHQKALFVKSLVFLSTVVDIMTKAAYLSLQVRAINIYFLSKPDAYVFIDY